MKIRYLAAVSALVLSFSGTAQAQSDMNPYTECGVGAAIFENDIAAAISNIIWDLGTTAVASATISPETCKAYRVETAMMILETLPDLEKELAMSKGKNVDTLMTSLQCSEGAASLVAASYEATLVSPGYATMTEVEKATSIYQAVERVSATSECAVAL